MERNHVEEYQLCNDNGFEIKLSNLRCTLLNILWPKEDGSKDDILLGYDTIEDWFDDRNCFGSTAGRCCNRISDSTVTLGGKLYHLNANIPPHQLHGGIKGFNKKIWRAYPFTNKGILGVSKDLSGQCKSNQGRI